MSDQPGPATQRMLRANDLHAMTNQALRRYVRREKYPIPSVSRIPKAELVRLVLAADERNGRFSDAPTHG